ncbi:dipeptidase PepE [Aliidiomarina sp. Khilg15.8]
MANLLLISSSKADNSPYLEHAQEWLKAQVGTRELLFIPYAGVTMSHSEYTERVRQALKPAGIRVRGIESFDDPVAAIEQAEAVAVGGGNTFVLLATLYQYGLLDPIRRRVKEGMPYAGWSAGSNIAGLSIRTTNDMPIVQPPSFTALGLVPFQLNPHYTDYQPPGHHGETRDMRLAEFMVKDPHAAVLAIREGTALRINDGRMHLAGSKDGVVFRAGSKNVLKAGQDCSQWL